MSNYCGIGIDAELSLDFHQAREEEPGKFTSRYCGVGRRTMFGHVLPLVVTLTCCAP